MIRRILSKAIEVYIKVKGYLLGDYYFRLWVQAMYLYRQSPLFKERCWEVDPDYAKETFRTVNMLFFKKAQNENIVIRGRILLDSILHREMKPYVMRDDSIF